MDRGLLGDRNVIGSSYKPFGFRTVADKGSLSAGQLNLDVFGYFVVDREAGKGERLGSIKFFEIVMDIESGHPRPRV